MTASQSCSSCGQSYPTNHFPVPLLSITTPAPTSGSSPNLSHSTTSGPTTSDSNNLETISFTHPTQSSPPTTTTPNDTSVAANIALTRLDDQAETLSQLAVSFSKLHHLVQALCHDLSASNPPPTTVPSTNTPPAATIPTAPQPFLGPALPSAQLVYKDRLPPHDLGKLHNPAKVPTLKETEPGVLVNGVCVMVPEPVAVASSLKIFLCLLPNIRSFA
ncbi:uncharacterized protein UBRO_20201 [Ustilago bromivora]|uniref:Uncharacterized protein n=1 Tax=Ustilago bromivora TaxID=307758 RepID=A0A1K0GTF0_9BASI|nr:uncharacterized protein UBRO_20201 [Ustilago bromivora]